MTCKKQRGESSLQVAIKTSNDKLASKLVATAASPYQGLVLTLLSESPETRPNSGNLYETFSTSSLNIRIKK